MKKVGIALAMVVFFLGGCMTIRTYTVEKPRTDTDVKGNRGYLAGTPPAEPYKNKFGDTRKISVLEIEVRDKAKAKSVAAKEPLQLQQDQNLMPLEQEQEVAPALEEESEEESGFSDYNSQEDVTYVKEITVDEPQEEVQQYVVQKDDTLQKISKKFYGTTRKWKYIYNANKNVIKNPDKIYPGLKLTIPALD